MQAIMCTDDNGVLDPTALIPIQMDGHATAFRSVASLSLVELGKKLLLSAKEGDTDQVRSLMSKGAPFTTDWLGTSPLHLAAQYGHVNTAEVLLRAGISRDARTKVERTPLHIAAQEGNTAIVQLLLNAGAEVDSRDMLKMTPLHWAIEREHLNTVELLLQYGANPQCMSKFNKTAFSIALDNNRHDIIELLQTANTIQTVAVRTSCQSQELQQATQSLALELAHAPAASHQEEVETSSGAGAPRNHPASFHGQKGNKFTYRPTASWGTEVSPEADSVEEVFIPTEEKTPTHKAIQQDLDPVSGHKTLQLLQAHGITMLPTDDSTLVASAVESGQTVVLTEAGKMALNLTRSSPYKVTSGTIQRSTTGPGALPAKKKVITIRAGQLLSMASNSKGPNILKRVTTREGDTITTAPTKVLLKTTPIRSKLQISNQLSTSSPTDLAAITKQLEEARREAEAYKALLTKKEREAEQYKRQLQSMAQGK